MAKMLASRNLSNLWLGWNICQTRFHIFRNICSHRWLHFTDINFCSPFFLEVRNDRKDLHEYIAWFKTQKIRLSDQLVANYYSLALEL